MKLSFEETVKKLNIDQIVENSGTVIVGFSGGADSSCLLYNLVSRYSGKKITIAAAHVNHMIRGKEADRDEEFCRECAEKLHIPFYSLRANVPEYAKENGMGLEEAARKVRYDFFSNLSEKLTGDRAGAVIATAHNSSDNLETVIMNMLRGSGLHGMSGIMPVRDGRIIRPLIYDSGEAIRQWCEENGICYVVDSTNAETDCTRNIIRHKIVPLFREISSSPENAVSKMTSLLREDDDYLSMMADRLIENGKIDRNMLESSPDSVASRALIKLFGDNNGETLSSVQIKEILRLSREKDGFSSVSLPRGKKVLIDRKTISVDSEEENGQDSGDFVFEYHGGEEVFDNGLWKLSFSRNIPDEFKDKNMNKFYLLRSFDCDKIKGVIKVRYKVDGDTYIYGGHTHKVKKLFTDSKLGDGEKKLTPIICDDDGIMYIPGFRARDGIRWFEDSGKEAVHLICERSSQ